MSIHAVEVTETRIECLPGCWGDHPHLSEYRTAPAPEYPQHLIDQMGLPWCEKPSPDEPCVTNGQQYMRRWGANGPVVQLDPAWDDLIDTRPRVDTPRYPD